MKLKLNFLKFSYLSNLHLIFISFLLFSYFNNILLLRSENSNENKNRNRNLNKNTNDSQFLESSSLSTSMESGLERELFKLASKLHNKRISEKKEKEKNFLDVKVEKSYDISEYSNFIEEIKNNNEEQKDIHKKSIEELKEKLDNKINMRQKNLKNLKNKYDKIIEKSTKLSNDLNLKKTEEIKSKAKYDSYKNEYEIKGDRTIRKIRELNNSYELNQKGIKEYNSELNNVKKIITFRRNSKQEYIEKEKEFKIKENELSLENKLIDEANNDKKFLEIINKNSENEAKQISLFTLKQTANLENLQKVSKDSLNMEKLEIELNQQNEYSRNYRKNIRNLLKENEKFENEVKDMKIKKNKLDNEIAKKEIENKLQKNEQKNKLNELENEIKSSGKKLMEKIKDQRKVD
jgi:hypothetical protein